MKPHKTLLTISTILLPAIFGHAAENADSLSALANKARQMQPSISKPAALSMKPDRTAKQSPTSTVAATTQTPGSP